MFGVLVSALVLGVSVKSFQELVDAVGFIVDPATSRNLLKDNFLKRDR